MSFVFSSCIWSDRPQPSLIQRKEAAPSLEREPAKREMRLASPAPTSRISERWSTKGS